MLENKTPERVIDPEHARRNLSGITNNLNAALTARKVIPARQYDGAVETSCSQGDDDARVVLTRTQYPDGSQPTRYSTSITHFRADEKDPTIRRMQSITTRSWEAGAGEVKTTLFTNEDKSHVERVELADETVSGLLQSDLNLADALWKQTVSAQETSGEVASGVPDAVAGLAIRETQK